MKGKLIKTSNGIYDLFEGTRFISTTDSPDGTANKLSLKNCQAIERGYDLEELADEFAKTKSSHSTFQNTHKRDFREGFQKALELMGDKKFSEKDMINFAIWVFLELGSNTGKNRTNEQLLSEWISLQQTEWDVEIEMGYIGECNGNNGDGCFQDSSGHNCGCFERKPKLDEDGCLILKRVKEKPKKYTYKELEEFEKAPAIDLTAKHLDYCAKIVSDSLVKQETLEEAALRIYQYVSENPPYTTITPKDKIEGFIEGAKWMQEQMEKLKDFDTWKEWKNKSE